MKLLSGLRRRIEVLSSDEREVKDQLTLIALFVGVWFMSLADIIILILYCPPVLFVQVAAVFVAAIVLLVRSRKKSSA